jgi:hypothetical protein
MPSWIVATAFSFMFAATLVLTFVFVFVIALLLVISALRFVHAALLPAGVEAIRKLACIPDTGSCRSLVPVPARSWLSIRQIVTWAGETLQCGECVQSWCGNRLGLLMPLSSLARF